MSIYQDPSTWRLQTAGGIPYSLKSLEGEYNQESCTATEAYIIRASDLWDFAVESFPFTISFGGFLVFGQERTMPGSPTMDTKRVKYKGLTDGKPIDPFGVDPGAPEGTYEQFLEVTIDYEQMEKPSQEPDEDDPQTFLEISSTASTNMLANTEGSVGALWQAPFGEAPYNTGAVNVNIPVTVIEPSIEWSFRWPMIPYQFFSDTLIARLRSNLGKVNNGPTTLFHNAPAETILFLGYSINQTFNWRNATGITVPPMTMDFKFLEKSFTSSEGVQVTHNHMFRPGVGWRRLLVNGNPIFDQANLDNIFQR